MMGYIVSAFCISVLVIWLLIRYSLRSGYLMDVPNHRSSHTHVTPRGGGLGFITAFYGSVLVYFMGVPFLWFFLPALAVAGIGYADDVRDVSPRTRFLVQILIAFVTVDWGGLAIRHFQYPGGVAAVSEYTGFFLAVFFIVAMINVYNFMDGIDGLAGGLGIISSLFFSLYFLYTGQYEMGVIQLFLMAVLLGFLVWNYPKAKVFMGDVGAYFLGFNFAVLVLYSSQVAPVKVAFIAGMSWLSVLAVDATVTILWRMIKRQRIWEAHREHFFQKLHLSGWQNQQIIWLEFAHAFFVSLLGVKYAFQASVGEQWVILAIAAISFVVKFWWIQTRWKRSLAPYELIKE